MSHLDDAMTDVDSAEDLQRKMRQEEIARDLDKSRQRLAELKSHQALVSKDVLSRMQRAERTRKEKDTCRNRLMSTHKIDDRSMRILFKRSRRRGLVSLMFFAVITGCELDLLGFAGAWLDYWDLNEQLVQILLIAMPCSYLFVSVMYLMMQQDPDAPGQAADERDGNTSRRLLAPTVILKIYHFFPLLRYLLLIKTIVPDDIEAVFRINSLSSFTLGTAQITSMIFTLMAGGEITLFVYVNMFSQLLNWSITLLYFMTPVARRMQSAIATKAYKANLTDELRRDILELRDLIEEDSKTLADKKLAKRAAEDRRSTASSARTPLSVDCDVLLEEEMLDIDDNTEIGKFRQKCSKEIQTMLNTQLDMNTFTPMEIMAIRRLLLIRGVDVLEAI